MYSPEHRLDTPPPSSQFRPRPWSPDPADPLPSLTSLRYQSQYVLGTEDHWTSPIYQRQRREASDPSVEALDLAEYANTLNPHLRRAAMPGELHPPHRYDEYPPSPPPTRPFSLDRRDSLEPPSLVSSLGTLSSQSHSPSYARHQPRRRPFSLPSSPSFPSPVIHHPPDRAGLSRPSLDRISARSPGVDSEIDIAHFPAWSRGWYASDKRARPPISPMSEPPANPEFFDPAFPTAFLPPFSSNNSQSYHSDGPYDPYYTSMNDSQRELLPWSNGDRSDYGAPLGTEMKEERMRMLEREFGGKGSEGKGGSGDGDAPVVGSVDGKGRLVTQGPKKRVTVRLLQAALALTIAVSSIYAALEIKPPTPPPPQSKPQTYVLYILSVLTVLLSVYLFLIRPCCCGGRRKASNLTGGLPGDLAVLPVQGLPGGGGKRKKGNKGKGEQGSVQVNLIVDPSMFQGPQHGQDEDEDSALHDDGLSSVTGGRPGRRPKRRSVFEGLAMEEMWKHARKELKWMMLFDVVSLLLWGIEFVWVLLGKRCPPGEFEGWCNAFNVATAGACLLAVSFGLSVFFDVKDLHQSRQSPRTRT